MLGSLAGLVAAIQLVGVEGSELRARAFFDANNVKVGDPMVLTIDFLGEADFKDLHPPALAKVVGRGDWKLDDASAKTDTFRDARRLTYRVRPMREGVLWFPALEFEYEGPDGAKRITRSNEIPVHAKGGAQVVVEEMGEETDEMPKPPELIADVRGRDAPAPKSGGSWGGSVPSPKSGGSWGEGVPSPKSGGSWGGGVPPPLSEDELFRWRKAMAKPTADGFAEFDFPEARMNEATCAIREGNWARAMKVYSALEWRIGQTPEIEKGMIAALALKYDNPAVELPVWRQVLRPILRFGWAGRAGIVLGGFGALALLVWILGRGIRAVACVAVAAGFVGAVEAQGLSQLIREAEEQMNRMQQQMQQAMGSGGFFSHFGEKLPREQVRVTAAVATSKPVLQVGDPFEFIIALEYPRTASVGQIRLTPSESFGLNFTGQAQNLTDGKSSNPSNVVKRLALPARYDVPYRGKIAFAISGMVTGTSSRNRGMFTMSFSNSFQTETEPLPVDVRPLPSANQPEDFAGIVSEGLRVHETCDILTVETNDVVTITYRMFPKGYVPADFLPKGSAFEWMRQTDREGLVQEIEYRRYFVADGAATTPELVISYYDPRTKSYKSAKTGGTPLKYDIIR